MGVYRDKKIPVHEIPFHDYTSFEYSGHFHFLWDHICLKIERRMATLNHFIKLLYPFHMTVNTGTHTHKGKVT